MFFFSLLFIYLSSVFQGWLIDFKGCQEFSLFRNFVLHEEGKLSIPEKNVLSTIDQIILRWLVMINHGICTRGCHEICIHKSQRVTQTWEGPTAGVRNDLIIHG